MALTARPVPWLLALLVVLFFASGACALVYQVLWLRLLSLVFGVTVYAASTVLAGFMAGLAVGSYAAGWLAARFARPLAAFGLVEALVGLTALATPAVFDALKGAWVSLHPRLPDSLAAVTAMRFLAAFAVLVVPTSLMGATLPIVVRSALARRDRIGGRIGLLYAVNTAGAIIGALAAGFYLIAEIGVARSFQIAASVNLAVGAIALASGLAMPRLDAAHDLPRAARSPAVAPPATPQQRLVLGTFALSGLMSLALEVIWFRVLVLFLRPTAYAFTIMLATVLFGIALGSAVATPVLQLRVGWLPVLAALQALIGLAAVLSFNSLSAAQHVWEAIGRWLAALGVETYLAPIIASSALAMLPAAVLLGLAFPIGLAIWTGDEAGDAASRRVGTFYAVNVCGAIVGSALAGFVLLPVLGSLGSLQAVAALSVLSSIVLALSLQHERPRTAGLLAAGAPLAFALAASAAVDPFDLEFERFHRGERLVWRKEGVQTTVAIHDRPGPARAMRIMYLDGHHQANDSDAMAFVHHRIGALPVMLHPRPTTALVTGLGGGATAGAVARFGVSVEVVELSAGVVEGAGFFKHINFDLFSRPNVHLRVDDGRNFLLTERRKYDVITADIILPRHAGAGLLYSHEYFQLVRNRLADGGLVLQWNGAETETEYKLLARTFLSVFPYTTLWAGGGLMLGSLRPFTLSRSTWEAKQHLPGFRDFFRWDLDALDRNYVAGPEALRRFLGDGPVLTDDRPAIEYFLSLPKNDRPGGYDGPKADLREILTP